MLKELNPYDIESLCDKTDELTSFASVIADVLQYAVNDRIEIDVYVPAVRMFERKMLELTPYIRKLLDEENNADRV